MPIDPRELRPGKSQIVEVIENDRFCNRCRYNLKGLPLGGKCPECGKPIAGSRRGKRFVDTLADAPLAYLKTLSFGVVLLALSSVLSAFAFYFLSRDPGVILAAVAGVASTGWLVGVFIATAPRQTAEDSVRDAVLDSAWLRLTNRWLQASGLAAALLWVLVSRYTPGTIGHTAAWWGASIMGLIGLFGLVPLSVQLSSLADWAGDTSLSERFKVVAWAMALCGIIATVGRMSVGSAGVLDGLLFLATLWAILLRSLAQLVFLFALFQLMSMTVWAIRNHNTASEVNRRLQDRRDAHAMELAERTVVAAALLKHGPPARPAGPVRTAMDTNVVQRPNTDGNPYGLEPETAADDGP